MYVSSVPHCIYPGTYCCNKEVRGEGGMNWKLCTIKYGMMCFIDVAVTNGCYG